MASTFQKALSYGLVLTLLIQALPITAQALAYSFFWDAKGT